jgi:hypothetical protein
MPHAPPDAVAEVKVQTNLYDAEYGRTGGGVITLSLKSGTNDLHGNVGWLCATTTSTPTPSSRTRAAGARRHSK